MLESKNSHYFKKSFLFLFFFLVPVLQSYSEKVISTESLEITISQAQILDKVGVEYFEITPSYGYVYIVISAKYKNTTGGNIYVNTLPSMYVYNINNARHKSDEIAVKYYSMQIDFTEKYPVTIPGNASAERIYIYEADAELIKQKGWYIRIDSISTPIELNF